MPDIYRASYPRRSLQFELAPPPAVEGPAQPVLIYTVQELARLAALFDSFQLVAHGGLRQSGYNPGTIGTTSQTIEFDAAALTLPQLVTQDVANNALILEHTGVWHVGYTLELAHNELNAGRELAIETIVDGAPAGPTREFFTGRNQAGTNITGTILFDGYALDVAGKAITLGIRALPGSSYTASELRGVWHFSHNGGP